MNENLKIDTDFFQHTRKLSDKSDVAEQNTSDVLSVEEKETVAIDDGKDNVTETDVNLSRSSDRIETNDLPMETVPPRSMHVEENQSSTEEHPACNVERNDKTRDKDEQTVGRSVMPDVLIISDTVEKKSKQTERTSPSLLRGLTPPERKVKKIERQKSKPATPPSPSLKISRDECDWDSLFDDNGDCLDPTLIEEVGTASYCRFFFFFFFYILTIDYSSPWKSLF